MQEEKQNVMLTKNLIKRIDKLKQFPEEPRFRTIEKAVKKLEGDLQ